MKSTLLNSIFRTLRHLGSTAHAAFFRKQIMGESIVPDGFDWEFYLDFHSDLRQAGLHSEADAIKHYARHGFFEKRIIRAQDKTLIAGHENTRLHQLHNIALFNDLQRRIIKNNFYDRTISVSVVITVYNYAAYIDRCVNSVLNNTLKDIEIIIVNDCSTDDSLARCRKFLCCAIPITIIDKQTNTGLAHSRNVGIQLAAGEYIFILDADNELYPRCLEEHLNTIRRSNAIACYAVIDVHDESGAFCGQASNRPFDLKKLYNGNYIDAMALFNRDELIAIGAYNEHLLKRGIGYEDYELWLRIGQQGKSVDFIERSLSRYLKKQESMLSVADKYYHTPLMSFIKHTYFTEHLGSKTAILITGMHRSGTSALTGLIGLLGADLGPDLIGPAPSNVTGHFEPRKIVAVNEELLEKLGARAPGSPDMPPDWLEQKETKEARVKIQEILRHDFSDQDLFVIKDPRLCLLLPLYRALLEEEGISVKIIIIQRNREEVIKSLNERDGMPAAVGQSYYEKHIRALKANLTGVESLCVSFDRLIETTETVIEQISAFIPRLSGAQHSGMKQELAKFINPSLRHHRQKPAKTAHNIVLRVCRRITGDSGGPDFLIIGAQRAGTTSLYHYLCLHPQIMAPATKELHWFHAGPAKSDGYHTGHRSQQWYERQLRPSKNFLDYFHLRSKKLTFEATPEYIFHPLIAENVGRLYPAMKIIVLLRDPLERAVSQYYHEKKHGFIDTNLCIEDYFAGDRARAAIEEPKLINDHEYYSHSYEHHCPISRSNYGKQLDRWMRVFPRQQILIARSEEMFHDPFPVLNTVCSFLAIKPYPENVKTGLTTHNSCERTELSDEQRKNLTEYFPFDLSIEKFCTPPQSS